MPARSRRSSRMVRPHVALVTTVAPVHIEHLGSIEAIADAKAEIFAGSSRAASPSSTATRRSSSGCAQRADRARRARPDASARSGGATRGCSQCRAAGEGSARARARCSARELRFRPRRARRAHGGERAGVLLAAARARAPISTPRAARWRGFAPPKGAGRALHAVDARRRLRPDRRELQRQSRFDARRARAARRDQAGPRRPPHRGASATCWSLGRKAPTLHAAPRRRSRRQHVDLLFGAGPLMRALYRRCAGADARRLGRAVERPRASRRSRRCGPATS